MDPTTTPALDTSGKTLPAPRFVRLNAFGPVGLNSRACLPLHKTWLACTRCQDACPLGCLQLEAGTLRLDASRCNGCGRCAVACPTDALAVDGFALDDLVIDGSGPTLSIGCRDKLGGTPGVAAVPCLSGLSRHRLIRLLGWYPELRITLIDAADCPSCAGHAASLSAAQKLAAAVREVLVDCGLPADRIVVQSEMSPLPNGNGTELTPFLPRAGRRSFFSSLGRAVSQTVVQQVSGGSPLIDPASLPKQARQTIPCPGGHETRQLMLALASQAGKGPARARLPRLTVSGPCCADVACSRLCPTGALHSSVHGDVQSLSFDPWRCIDCGACSTACPDKVLHYEAPASRPFAPGAMLLSRIELARCERCHDACSSAGDSGMCPACRKSVALSQAGFSLFAGLRKHLPAETGPP